ncbi:DUF1990 family protein [Oleiharenicola lentus]|uniref:DUF1990 family protein n=1 Tax=Oleiharenicola lentus TaxID=2508720 RepID=UPI003F664E91
MWSLAYPSEAEIRKFLEVQSSAHFSYTEAGASRGAMLAGYNIDVNRGCLGHGERAFDAACDALRAWKMFPESWTKILPERAPLSTGTTVAMLAHVYGFWWLNACRVVYTINETTPVRRFGFAYGTLKAHVETGEERFSIEWLPDDSVWYDLRAFSQPRYWPVKLFKPLARAQQRRFAVESKTSMQRAVGEALA